MSRLRIELQNAIRLDEAIIHRSHNPMLADNAYIGIQSELGTTNKIPIPPTNSHRSIVYSDKLNKRVNIEAIVKSRSSVPNLLKKYNSDV